MLAVERRRFILDKIQKEGRVLISELSEELAVSRMTVHRDIAYLANKGSVRKVHGGAVAETVNSEKPAGVCSMCGMRIRQRLAFVIQLADGSQLQACCPHCGLMMLKSREDVTSALAADFLHGRMINVRSATFLANSEITLCCTPTILCFQRQEEAERFRRGFGGEVIDMTQAQTYLHHSMMLGEG